MSRGDDPILANDGAAADVPIALAQGHLEIRRMHRFCRRLSIRAALVNICHERDIKDHCFSLPALGECRWARHVDYAIVSRELCANYANYPAINARAALSLDDSNPRRMLQGLLLGFRTYSFILHPRPHYMKSRL